MSGLVHFYFGDRIKAFETGLGTIIRSEGHSLKTTFIVFNDNYNWIKNLESRSHLQIQIINKTEIRTLGLDAFKSLSSNNNHTILVANVDLFLCNSQISVNDFIKTIEQVKPKNEIILTSEEMIEELFQIADYASEFSIS
jgi:ATP:corrinoid adenosyltransferase